MSNIQPYIILNGTDSRSISGLLISSLPPISKPQVRTQIETVDGRDGDIVTPLGFSAYDKVINIGLTYNYDVDEIIEFFNSEGIVTFSNEPDKYYRYAIYEQIDFEKLIRFKTAEVTLHVQPFKFSTTEEPELFDVVSGQAIAVTNEGNTDSRPNLTIIGSGDIDVSLNGSQTLSIELEDDQAVIIDSEDMNAYAAQSAIREVVADIEPIQDLHGYSKPWSGGGGKNKFSNVWSDYTKPNDYRICPITLTNGQTYKLSATLKGTTMTDRIVVAIVKDGTQYSNFVGFTQLINANGEINTLSSFTIDNTWVNPKLAIYCSDEAQFNRIFANYNVQLEQGSTATSYEPYSNICPISGFSALNVTRTGKNKLNYNAWKTTGITRGTAVWENNGVTLTATANDCYTLTSTDAKIPISEGETITLSWEETTNKSGQIFIFPNGTTSGMITVNNGVVKKVTYTATSGITFVTFRFGVANSGDTIAYKNIQIENGNQATDFEPYNGQTVTVNFGQTVYGGVADITNGKVTVTHGIVDLGTLNWISEESALSGLARVNQTQVIPLGAKYLQTPICTQFEGVYTKSYVNFNNGEVGFSNSEQLPMIRARSTEFVGKTNEQIKALMSGVMLCYELAIPTEIQLTPTQINNLLGVNNMYSDTGDITVKHKSNGVIVTDTGDIVSFYAGLDDIEKGILLNRAITGDYDKIRLRKGVNTFVLSGNARQFAIDKYSRWI